MKIKTIGLIVMFLTTTFILFGQKYDCVQGTWVKEANDKSGIIFTPDSTIHFFGPESFDADKLKIKLQYKILSKDENSYIIIKMIREGVVIKSDTSKYKIENGKLYLRIQIQNMKTGEINYDEYKDIYIRKEDNNPLIGKWVKTKSITNRGDTIYADKKAVVNYTSDGKQYIFINDKKVEEATSIYTISGDTIVLTLEFQIGDKIISNTERIYYEIKANILICKLSDGTITYYKQLIKEE